MAGWVVEREMRREYTKEEKWKVRFSREENVLERGKWV